VRPRVALALLVLGGGCRGDRAAAPGGRVVLVTQVPAAAAAVPAGLEPWPESRYPSGSRVVRLDLDDPAAPAVALSRELDAAGGARISHDARRVLFVGRERAGEPFALWECAPDGKRRRRLVTSTASCEGGAFLPDGRVAYAAAVGTGAALFVADGDGSEGLRITFGGGLALDPAVTRDGRLVFAGRHGGGEGGPPEGDLALFTVHPDGTGIALLHGPDAAAGAPLGPRPTRDGSFVHALRAAAGRGRIRILDGRAPADEGQDVDVPTGVVSCAVPTADGHVLLAARGVAGDRSGLVLIDRAGAVVGGPWPDEPGWQTVDVVEVASRPRPQGQLSSVNASLSHGELLCVEAREPGGAAAVTAVVRAGQETGEAPGELAWRSLGEVPLEEDGSFFARVPADTPLLVDLVDVHGRVVTSSRTPFWLRPGEKRACVGCHEAPDTTPPNRRPLAVLRAPVDLVVATAAGVGP
jgi:hypothetical protein